MDFMIIILFLTIVSFSFVKTNESDLKKAQEMMAKLAKKSKIEKMMKPELIQTWAQEISDIFYKYEDLVVRRRVLSEGFDEKANIEVRNGSAIVERVAAILEDLLIRRAKAAENIMRQAEELAKTRSPPPSDYTFDLSKNLGNVKPQPEPPESDDELPSNCTSQDKVLLKKYKHFDAMVSPETTSVHVAAEVFECDDRVLPDIYWSEELLQTFRNNYAQDASLDFQYFCSAQGFLRHYPAASWESMLKLDLDSEDAADVYDCRLRPWYVSANGAPRDVLILIDASGSIGNSTENVAEHFTLSLLSALTDDDQVNVLRFNVIVESPIKCFNDRLVPANHVNSAAMMAALKKYKVRNETKMDLVLEQAVKLLQKQYKAANRPTSCQQAIVLLTDCLYDNYTALMNRFDPKGKIRLFVMWLHDPYGLRDNSRDYGEWISCDRDGYFAELITPSDVTEQVMRILRVMERPLVAQREQRLNVYSDVYAHLEDPRRSEYYWKQKEQAEQRYRYNELRRDKKRLLNNTQMMKDYYKQQSLDKYGQYYEGHDVNYRQLISVSVPVFDYTTSQNITKVLRRTKRYQITSTRTYPVNRLLGVAGVDIPIDHLKLMLPYYLLGAGGSLIIADHRGNIVLHDNTKPVFDGDVLKPGYRTVDFLDLEQSAVDREPRNYTKEWIEFRREIIIDRSKGNRTMFSKNVYESGMRMLLEMRDYYWQRVLDHYTVAVVLSPYSRRHAVPKESFTKELAEEAYKALARTDFAINPDWLYCRYFNTDQRHNFDAEFLVRHFLNRRRHEPNFQMRKLSQFFSHIEPALTDRPYQCFEELMARMSKEAIATTQWAEEHEDPDHGRSCGQCKLGSVTAFFAGESGLSRWQQYHAISGYLLPPEGNVWPRGPTENWYKRAVAAPDTLVIHVPVAPVRNMRNSDVKPPPLGQHYQWMTAARTLRHPRSNALIGVAGYHFHPKHLEDVLDTVTNFPCVEEDVNKCEVTCDGKNWTCVLVDEEGWVLAGGKRDYDVEEDAPREHLATLHPAVMTALLNANVYKLHWLHDYQGVCFTPKNAASLNMSMLRSLWRTVKLLFHFTREMLTVITFLNTSVRVMAETQADKMKRHDSIIRNFERNKFDELYDERVRINRTTFAACDRSRPLYELQKTQKAMQALKRAPKPCSWPLVGALVPKTNLVLIAMLNRCIHTGRPVPDPLVNEPVNITEYIPEYKSLSAASQLACWRNVEPLLARPPHTHCFPHKYPDEEGYRQCGPWIPDRKIQEE